MKHVLILFQADWDFDQFEKSVRARGGDICLHREGFDLFRFPDNARLLTFDVFRFVDRLVRKYAHLPLSGVTSSNEQFGALAASILAQRLGLPGADPSSVIAAQHKFVARRILDAHLPEANVRYAAFPYTIRRETDIGLPFPFHVKPVKAAFSVLARRVDNFQALRQHLTFRPWEKFIIKRLVRPFNDAVRRLTDFDVDAHWMLAEELIDGVQVNVDGVAVNGEIHIFGIVDAVMYPGTDQFMRFEYPTRLPAPQARRACDTARRIVEGLGITHGLFNVELRVCPETGRCRMIEVNPRMAAQFSDLYEKVEGINFHDIALQLALDEPPMLTAGRGKYRVATSFVFRTFDGTSLTAPPTREMLNWLREFDPDALLALFVKSGTDLKREMKWLGSHRYATLNMGAASDVAMREKLELIQYRLGFERG